MKLVSQLGFAVVTALPSGLPKGASLVLSSDGHLYTFDGTVWIDNGAAGGGAAGNGIVGFGAVPGNNDAVLVVTGQTAIVATSKLRVQVVATDTVDHSADEHWLDAPIFTAGNIVPGVGFTIYGRSSDLVLTPQFAREFFGQSTVAQPDTTYGQWSVSWGWV